MAPQQTTVNVPPETSLMARNWFLISHAIAKAFIGDYFLRSYYDQKLMWPRAFNEDQQKRNNIKFKLLQRVQGQTAKDVYVASTSIRKPGVQIGLGLFADALFYPGETLLYYEGN